MATPCTQPDAFLMKKWDAPGASAYYACRHFNAIEDTNIARNIISGFQLAFQYVLADKEYEIKKQQQQRLDNIANIELGRSGEIHGQFTKGIACEDAMRDAACSAVATPPNRDDIRRRVTADVIRRNTATRAKIRSCYPVNCAKAMCSELKKLTQRENATIAALTEATWQKETALYEQRKATIESWKYQTLAMGRGGFSASTALMQGALAATQASAQINPYRGFNQVGNAAFNTLRDISLQEARQFAGMGISMRGQQGLTSTNGTQITSSSIDYRNQMDIESDNYGISNLSRYPTDGSLANMSDGQYSENNALLGDWNPP